METDFPNVYAIGDITYIPLEMGKPLPKAGVFTHYQAETVAHNIAHKITGKTPDKKFNGDGTMFSLKWETEKQGMLAETFMVLLYLMLK
ncbi:MAG: hypothetical protein IPJ51_02010 [Saprospiraceae bacterium]|nr:hypothetical protein [Saprospiraceae bacterium]